MKKSKYIFSTLLLFIFIFISCEDLEKVENPDFSIVFKNEVKAGELVDFQVKNSPYFLYFYAGDFGHEYEYRNRTESEEVGKATMSFLNSQKWGLGPNREGTLTVWYSRDYNGKNTPEAVKKATWTEISDRFKISTRYDFTFQSSGIVNITDLSDGNPIFFGFKYFSDYPKIRGAEWYFNDLNIEADASYTPFPLPIFGKKNLRELNVVDVQGFSPVYSRLKWFFDTGKMHWRVAGSQGGKDAVETEDWLITDAINLTPKIKPDIGIPLKTYSEKLNSFSYTYNVPGVYTITLIGNNTTIYGDKKVIKEYKINVE